MSEFLYTKVRLARKEHVCHGCFALIPAGSYYESSAGVYEGDFWSAKLCPECVGHLSECDSCHQATCEGWGRGDLGEWRRECEAQERDA